MTQSVDGPSNTSPGHSKKILGSPTVIYFQALGFQMSNELEFSILHITSTTTSPICTQVKIR